MPLALVPTPIGCLEDITLRALRVLREADFIACEDGRTSSVLLRHHGVSAPLVPFHLHNENDVLPRLLAALRKGKRVVVISDAGTPGISDPGWILLRRAIDEGLDVDVLPGPSAILPALLLSGLAPHPFLFHGFPPEKKGERERLFRALAPLSCTLCFYVSPHKVVAQTEEMIEAWGARRCALVREISKIYQEAIRGTLPDVVARARAGLKGEMVLVVEGRPDDGPSDDAWMIETEALLDAGGSVRDIAADVSARYGVARNAVKAHLLGLRRVDGGGGAS